jgi:hypothetical protein
MTAMGERSGTPRRRERVQIRRGGESFERSGAEEIIDVG